MNFFRQHAALARVCDTELARSLARSPPAEVAPETRPRERHGGAGFLSLSLSLGRKNDTSRRVAAFVTHDVADDRDRARFVPQLVVWQKIVRGERKEGQKWPT